MDATWHSGPRGSTTRAHAAHIFILLHILYSKGIQSSVYQKGIHLTNPAGVINPTTNFFCV